MFVHICQMIYIIYITPYTFKHVGIDRVEYGWSGVSFYLSMNIYVIYMHVPKKRNDCFRGMRGECFDKRDYIRLQLFGDVQINPSILHLILLTCICMLYVLNCICNIYVWFTETGNLIRILSLGIDGCFTSLTPALTVLCNIIYVNLRSSI